MRACRGLAAGLLAGTLVMSVAACAGSSSSGGKSDRSTTSTKQTTTTTAPPNSAVLAQMLVGIDAVPSGYAQEPPGTPEDSKNDLKICGGAQLQEIVASPSTATVVYTGGTIGPGLGEYLSAYPSEKAAQAVLDAARAQLSQCTEFTQVDPDGTTFKYTLGALATGQFGDDHVAARVKAEMEGGYIAFDVIFTRTGSIVVSTFGFSVLSFLGGGQVQPGQLDSFTEAAVNKVNAAVKQ